MNFSIFCLLSSFLLVCNLASAQEALTHLCFFEAKTCDDFKRCCEIACPMGATAVCHANGTGPPATTTTKLPVGEMAFMAGAAAEEDGAPAAPVGNQGGIVGVKIQDTKCHCHENTMPMIPMTSTCLEKLTAPNRCPLFEQCCKDSCANNAAYAHLCGQDANGKPTADTECLCFNSLPNVPGWSDLENSKNGDGAPDADKVQYDDHDADCFNSSNNCKVYEDCCVDACKKVEHTGSLEAYKMCMGNKNQSPMKSTHTFCKCPTKSTKADVPLWSEGGRPGDVSSIFKGGSEGEEDGVGCVSRFPTFVYFSIAGFLLLFTTASF